MENIEMDKIIRGWQYQNHFTNQGVVKTPLSLFAAFKKRLVSSPAYMFMPLGCLRKAQRGLELANECHRLLENRPDLHEIFSLIEVKHRKLVQEQLIPVRNALGFSEYSDMKVVDAYFSFVDVMFSKGVFEYTFNLFDNFGFDSRGRVRLIDVGEFNLEKKDLLNKINNNACKPYSLRPIKYPSVKEHYWNKHKTVFSTEHVNKTWGRCLVG